MDLAALRRPTPITIAIEDMIDSEAQPLLEEPFEHQLRRAFVYHHQWRRGGLMMWDNRCTLHYACGDIRPPGIRHLLPLDDHQPSLARSDGLTVLHVE